MALNLRKRWTGAIQCLECLCVGGKADGQCKRPACACHAPGALVGLAETMPCYDCGCMPGPARPECGVRDFKTGQPGCCHRPKAAA